MDIIITEPVMDNMIETACLTSYSLDVELGTKASRAKNDFEIILSLDKWNPSMNQGSFVLSELFCGVIDGLQVNTAEQTITLHGNTIQKLLDDKVIIPPTGLNYYEIEDDAHIVMQQLIDPRFNGFIVASNVSSGFQIQLKARYDTVFEALEKSLSDVGARLHFKYNGSQIVVSAVSSSLYDYVEVTSDSGINIVSNVQNGYNHIVALGRGEMQERKVIELFYENGVISDTPIAEGLHLRSFVYDYSSVESEEQLRSEAEKKLLSMCGERSIEVEIDGDYEIGDCLHVRERISGLQTKAYVQKKIIKGTSDELKIEYKVGE